MRVTLIGADFEENLGVGMIAAVARGAGHRVRVVAFNLSTEAERIARLVVADAPDVVGLSMQFQHRAVEFLGLARLLRREGFRGHVTCGGQFPTLAWKEVLDARNGIDTIVLHEGEETFPELLAAIAARTPIGQVPGLAIRTSDGATIRTAPRRLVDDLDRFPFATRYREHTRHLGVNFIPIMGGRGCWGSCTYCSITSYFRDARSYGGGRLVRMRSPENVAREMAAEFHAADGPCIFCFHDDNLLLPRPQDTIDRMRAIRAELDRLDVGPVGIIGKCRPDCVTPDLAGELKRLGIIRLYVGVENAADGGAAHLRRTSQQKCIEDALAACRSAGIFVCYNLLLFEPDATLEDVRTNVQFIRDHAAHPVNFCRAEPYHGTPLQLDLSARQALGGSYLGWNYRIEDPRTEVLFRICSAAFRQRNFDPDGVGNRYMGLGYQARILEYFYPDISGRRAKLIQRAADLTRAIALDTATHLDDALELASSTPLDDADRIARETALLGLRIAAADRVWHVGIDELQTAMNQFARDASEARPRRRTPSALALSARRAAVGLSLAAWTSGLNACSTSTDPVPSDTGSDTPDRFVVDPPPPDTGIDRFVVDPAPIDVIDTQDAMDSSVADRPDILVVDPPPPDSGTPVGALDPALEHSGDDIVGLPASPRRSLAVIDQWRDTTSQGSVRTSDLPLHSPPRVSLRGERDGAHWRVRLQGGPAAVTTRWESDGEVRGSGREVAWIPASGEDQLRVAVRSSGGVAVVAIRAGDLGT